MIAAPLRPPRAKPLNSLKELLASAKAHAAAGNWSQAEALYQRAVDLNPYQPTALHQLGVLAFQRGSLSESERWLRHARAAAPHDQASANNLAVVLEKQGKYQESAEAYKSALAIAPGHARVHFNYANVLRTLGQWSEALESFERSLQLEPNNPDTLHNLGALLKELGRREEARERFRSAIALRPDMVDAHVNLGAVLQGMGHDSQAMEAYSHALQIHPGYPDAAAGKVNLLFRQGDISEACELITPLIPLAASNPDVATAFAAVAGSLKREPEAIEALSSILERHDLLLSKRQAALFALGKLLDAQHRYAEAFDSYQRANQSRPRQFLLAEFKAYSLEIQRAFSAGFLASAPRSGLDSRLPLFVVGMPRSGTSLVEQILASHPDVFGAGELPGIERLALSLPDALGSALPYPECVSLANEPALRQAALTYLNLIQALAPAAQHVVDKMPGNFMHIGLITLLFPNARVIHIQREAQDNCLSCYFQNFNNGHEYSYDLEDLGKVYVEYQKTMAHWQSVPTVPILHIRYEELVHDQEAQSRRLLAFCGLDWDARCLDFHKTRRQVRTASYDQVRKPMYTASAGRHQHYLPFLQPLRQALGFTSMKAEV